MRACTALAILTALAAASPADAALWCGFHDQSGAVVRCGFLTAAECHEKLGSKDTICMPDPEFASRRLHPSAHKPAVPLNIGG